MIRGLLVDIEGTVLASGQPIPGAQVALQQARSKGLRVCFLTNSSLRPRSQIMNSLRKHGILAQGDECLTPVEAAAQAARDIGLSVLWYVHPDIRAHCEMLVPVSGVGASKVAILGEMRDHWTGALLDEIAEYVLAGTAWWCLGAAAGYRRGHRFLLDVGAYAAAIRCATRVTPRVFGKPDAGFFNSAAAAMDLTIDQCVMIGDDVDTDIVASIAAGARAVQVMTGKACDGNIVEVPGAHVIASIANLDTDALEASDDQPGRPTRMT